MITIVTHLQLSTNDILGTLARIQIISPEEIAFFAENRFSWHLIFYQQESFAPKEHDYALIALGPARVVWTLCCHFQPCPLGQAFIQSLTGFGDTKLA